MKRIGVFISCKICKKDVRTFPSAKRQYCSKQCSNIGLSLYNLKIGKRPPQPVTTSVLKICSICHKQFLARQSMLKKGFAKYCSKECSATSQRGMVRNQIHLWEGTKNSYRNLHKKVGRRFGLPTICEGCGRENLKGKEIHWANRNGIYNLRRDNWIRLCARCHIRYDRNLRTKFMALQTLTPLDL